MVVVLCYSDDGFSLNSVWWRCGCYDDGFTRLGEVGGMVTMMVVVVVTTVVIVATVVVGQLLVDCGQSINKFVTM